MDEWNSPVRHLRSGEQLHVAQVQVVVLQLEGRLEQRDRVRDREERKVAKK